MLFPFLKLKTFSYKTLTLSIIYLFGLFDCLIPLHTRKTSSHFLRDYSTGNSTLDILFLYGVPLDSTSLKTCLRSRFRDSFSLRPPWVLVSPVPSTSPPVTTPIVVHSGLSGPPCLSDRRRISKRETEEDFRSKVAHSGRGG